MATNSRPARRAGSGTFALESEDASQPTTAARSPRTVGSIDALIALQGVEDATERRRRSIKRGRSALDALDELKLGLLVGNLDTAALARLKSTVADLNDASGDQKLDLVLAEIGLRVEVELAKFGTPQSRANRTK